MALPRRKKEPSYQYTKLSDHFGRGNDETASCIIAGRKRVNNLNPDACGQRDDVECDRILHHFWPLALVPHVCPVIISERVLVCVIRVRKLFQCPTIREASLFSPQTPTRQMINRCSQTKISISHVQIKRVKDAVRARVARTTVCSFGVASRALSKNGKT